MRILYVDDERLAVKAVVRELRAVGDMTVTGLSDPLEAVEKLRQEPFDVVLSDFSMPGMDGVDVLAEAYKLRPGARRLLLTGSPEEPKVRAAAHEGLVEIVLAKPVSVAELLAALGVERRERKPKPDRV